MESQRTALTTMTDAPAVRTPARIDGKNLLFTIVWLGIYLACVIPRAIQKPFWYDEIFTWYLSGLPSFGELWACLRKGTDPNPPLHYVLVHVSNSIFGAGQLATRLPTVFGYLLMSFCLYKVARRHVPSVFAWTAATLPLVTEASGYAIEARSYGLMLGFGAAGLLCWQVATEDNGLPRKIALILLPLCLGAAVTSHYFAVLVFIPLGVGELTRSWLRRKIDLPLWCALVAGLFPLLLLRELMQGASTFKGTFWSRPGWSYGFQCYAHLFKEAAIPLVTIAVLLAIDVRFPLRAFFQSDAQDQTEEPRPIRVPTHEFVAALTFVALPFLGLAFSKIAAGGAFAERYALATVFGFSLLLAYSSAAAASHRTYVGALITLGCLVWFLGFEGYRYQRDFDPQYKVTASDYPQALASDQPLVLSWSFLFLQAQKDLPKELAERSYFLTGGDSTDEFALTKLSERFPMKVENMNTFVDKHKEFFLCGFPSDRVYRELIKADAQLTVLSAHRFRGLEVLFVRVKCKG